MAKIIISYRRADTDAIAGRIRDRLTDHYSDDAVFMDVDDIPFGIDFREHIKEEFADGDILVAVVGPEWLGRGEDGRLRIAETSDPVRVEVEAALQRDMPVIPVLVHDAVMPTADELPDTIKGFAYHNAAEVDTGRDFHPHVDRLIRSIDEVLKAHGKAGTPAHRLWLVGSVAAACAALLAGSVWYYQAKVATQSPGPAPAAIAASPLPPQIPSTVPSASQPQTARGRSQMWQAHDRVTAAELPALVDSLRKDGYRLRTITPYVADGAEQYASLWMRDGGPEWQTRYGLTTSEFRKVSEDLEKDGYRTTWISAHELGGELRYAGIYERTDLPVRRVRLGIASNHLRSMLAEFAKEGLQPVHLYGYSAAGVASFAVIFENRDDAPLINFDLAPPDFQKFTEEQTKQGYRPKMVSGYRVGNREYRAGIWEKTTGAAWFSRVGPVGGYLTLHDNMAYQGYRPLFLAVFSVGNLVRAASIWENTVFEGELGRITSRMQSYLRTHQVPGAAIAITKDGRLVYAAGFGQADRTANLEATPASRFRIGGVSKAITAVAILKLVEANKLSLDAKVFGPGGLLASRYPTPASNRKIEQITVRHLLQHRSGFSNSPDDPTAAYAGLAPDEIIRAAINDPARVLARDPGTQFEQSDFDYVVLGRVIEQVTGTTYEQHVRTNVLAPAGITDMSIGGDSVTEKKPREVTYYPDDAYSSKLAHMDAAGGWIASPIDLARFLVRVDGLATKPDIISAATHKLMTTGSKDVNDSDPHYGLGWHLVPQSHNGAMLGSVAYVAVLPGGFTVAALVNSRPASDETGQNLQNTLRDIVANVNAWPSYDLFDMRMGNPTVAVAR
jgi:CubicO group peptidase (beta-lactamase class C family)